MDDFAEGVGSVFRLIYRSVPRLDPDRRGDELDAIFRAARRHNVTHGVTGALLVWQDAFVQVLEGDEHEVHSLFARLHSDPRHEDLVRIEAGTVAERTLPRWSMARVGDGAGDVPVGEDRGAGVHPDPTPPLDTPQQQMVLDLMRDYARPDVLPR